MVDAEENQKITDRPRGAGLNQRFLRNEAAPYETTICKFRHLIEAKGLSKMMLTAVNDHLKSKGIKIGAGTIMDATLISAPSSTKNEEGERDPETRQTRKRINGISQ